MEERLEVGVAVWDVAAEERAEGGAVGLPLPLLVSIRSIDSCSLVRGDVGGVGWR